MSYIHQTPGIGERQAGVTAARPVQRKGYRSSPNSRVSEINNYREFESIAQKLPCSRQHKFLIKSRLLTHHAWIHSRVHARISA